MWEVFIDMKGSIGVVVIDVICIDLVSLETVLELELHI
jgi:hypothetical protein